MSNFEFLRGIKEYALFASAAIEAEKVYASAPAMCAVGCRKALELAVKWVYSADNTMCLPYRDNLQALIHEPTFRFAMDNQTWGKLPLLIKLGNLAVHTEKNIAARDALVSLRGLFEFIQWVDYCYGSDYVERKFDEKLIPLIINNALHGKKLPVYGDGKNVRDWLYVEDHAKAIDMVQEQGRLFQTYNIGGHNEKQNIEIIHIIIETLQEMLPDSDPRKAHINNDLITYVEDRKGHDRRYAIAPDKIKAEIGWYPETMFKEGIRKTIAWYFEHEDWMNNVTSGDYQKYYNEMYEEK